MPVTRHRRLDTWVYYKASPELPEAAVFASESHVASPNPLDSCALRAFTQVVVDISALSVVECRHERVWSCRYGPCYVILEP